MNDEKINNETQLDYVAPDMKLSSKIKDKLDEAGKKYPIWNPKIKGEVVGGKVEKVEFLEHLNQSKGGYIVRIAPRTGNKFVSFPNVVMLKKMCALTKTGELSELENEWILIQYIDEVQPQDTRLKPYKTYEVIIDEE